jgi:AcrR family transcriptional regulator
MPLDAERGGAFAPAQGAQTGTERQRERLLEAIAHEAGERGWSRTTVRRVVARAGVSRRTLYDLYETKDECFLAACDALVGHVRELTAEACRAEREPRERLDAALATLLRFCAEEPALARTYLVEGSVAGAAGAARWQAHVDELTGLVERTLAELGGERRPPPHAPTMIVGSVHTVARTRVLAGRAGELPELAPELSRSVWRMLGVA